MMKRGVSFTQALVFLLVASCAVITVNIYFPEKDVQEAYRALEEELMGPQAETKEDPGEAKPQSLLRFELAAVAYAQEESLSVKIADTVKRMPEVVEAYRQMGVRVSDMDRLRDAGLVGEANTGLLVKREGTLSSGDEKLVEMENENRTTVIRGMTKAIIRINRLPENEENMEQLLPQATEQFAAIRVDSAKKGWWVQDKDGNWSRKQ